MTNSSTPSKQATNGSVKSSKRSKSTPSHSNSKKKAKSDPASSKNHKSTSYSNTNVGTADHNANQYHDGYSIDRYVEDPVNANPEYSHSTVDDSIQAHKYTMGTYLYDYEATASGYEG